MGINKKILQTLNMAGKGRPAKNAKAAKAPKEGGVKKPRHLGPKTPKEDKLASYIYKVLKQVHPEIGINKATMGILNDLCLEVYQKLARNAGELSRHSGKGHLSAVDIQSAIKLTIPGELAEHAVNESTRAVAKYAHSYGQ